tara:strand:+ start:241 stop:465 length:225 start_codon:yes stop_codon:yes gene_type:complete
MSLIMKGMVSNSPSERSQLLKELLHTDAGRGVLHESFDPSDPSSFSREWFAWVNSLFGYWVADMVQKGTLPRSL